VVAGELCHLDLMVPSTLFNGSTQILANQLPEGVLIVTAYEGNQDGKTIPVTITSLGLDGKYEKYLASFTPTASGVVRVDALLFNATMSGSPQTVLVQSGECVQLNFNSETM
jgi:hypothetical protein